MGESTAWREKRLAPFGQEITAKGHFITEKRVRGKKETNYHNYEENSLPSPCFPRPNCIKGAHRVSHKGRIGAVLTAFFPRAAGYGGQPSKNRPRPGQGPSVQDFGFTGFQKPLCAASASPGATGHDKKGTNAGRTRPKGMFGDRFQRDRFPEGTRAAPQAGPARRGQPPAGGHHGAAPALLESEDGRAMLRGRDALPLPLQQEAGRRDVERSARAPHLGRTDLRRFGQHRHVHGDRKRPRPELPRHLGAAGHPARVVHAGKLIQPHPVHPSFRLCGQGALPPLSGHRADAAVARADLRGGRFAA